MKENKDKETQTGNNLIIDVHVSVDCVLIGFDGEQFRVLLVRQIGKQTDGEFNDLKLPGSLIYADEDLDEAAKRVLNELMAPKIVRLIRKMCCGWNAFIALRITKSAGLLRSLIFLY